MSKDLLRLADRVLNRPLLLTPNKAETVMAVLGGRIGLDVIAPSAPDGERTPSTSRFIGESRGVGGQYDHREYFRLVDGVAVITVDGALINKGAWVGAYSGLQSYEGLRAQIDLAMSDKDVKGILLDLESPGGEVWGCFELAAHIARCCVVKPIHAVADGMACSAAYILASACDLVTAIQSGAVGSIGVVLMHVDRSTRNEMEGVKPTLIHAGAHKVDGHPHAPLSAETQADLQAEINTVYEQFVDHVVSHRHLSADAVRATEARTFNGPDALQFGLIDAVGSFDDALAAFYDDTAVTTAQHRGLSMTTKNGQAAASGEGQVTQAELGAAVAAALEDGMKEGIKAEQDRVTGILGLESAKEHGAVALAAIHSGQTVEQAKATLDSLPKVEAATDDTKPGDLADDGAAQYAASRQKAESNQPDLGAGATGGKSEGGRLLARAQKQYGGVK
ncbi:signal peptide peptidase SppA [Cohaesibacter sp. ES.047]|uniref:S49 family peptidase n=1 Tax=Cohaesibacter sp. ES.047 TaxID=1798205 RepID=UPI000BBFED97|nr:S49 family peptidase [Cohaesibacter sp. ES.047]SNY93415.1 signal peptide peptidase SppA [Cohaesibacter sp. ES.047]